MGDYLRKLALGTGDALITAFIAYVIFSEFFTKEVTAGQIALGMAFSIMIGRYTREAKIDG